MTTQPGPSRRQLLTAGGAGLAASVLGAVVSANARPSTASPDPLKGPVAPSTAPPQTGAVEPHGPHQAGVHLPATPPTHLNFQVFSADAAALTREGVRETLAELGRTITALTAVRPRDPRLSAEPTALTVQIGIGARLLALTSSQVEVGLPAFAGSEAIAAQLRQGDLVLSVAAEHPETVAQSTDVLAAQIAEAGYRSSWSQIAFRPIGHGSVTRNPLGFDDGIVQPESPQGIPEHVFLSGGAASGGSIGVVRRFVLDTAGFAKLNTDEQEAVFGRVKETGAPLSGGTMYTDANVGTKTPDGQYLIPSGSHVRAAHPSFTGSALMLRRSYGFRASYDGHPDRSGLLFISYQDDVGAFTRTQLRMDREDRLMDFAEPTAEVSFLVLPGFDPSRPLGSALFSPTRS